MLSLNPNTMSERENYKMLIGSIIPRPVAVVTSLAKDGTLNIAPFSYFNIVTSNPPIISLSIQRQNGQMKDTAHHIVTSKEAVVHIAEESYIKDINQTATSFSSDESELSLTNFTLNQAKSISVPMLSELQVKMEVTLYQHIEIKDDHQVTADLLLLSVNYYHIDDTLYDHGRIDFKKLRPMSRLAGNDYAKIGEVITIERPV